ncbi:hypothetical protein AB0B79_05960 [Streptomyces sp. NPDC039022]|uniref:hypothetical protein n=1 Tax=unclassified Streptomyces TaxID=2593676 RepID=UPI0033D5C9E9
MRAAPRMTRLPACREGDGCPARVLETVSANLDVKRAGQQRADQAGDGAHTHITRDGDCLVVRPHSPAPQEAEQ